MENCSGLDPRGVAVLIKTYEPERKGAQIVLPDNVQGRMAMVDNRAIVVAVGPAAWKDEGYYKSVFFGLFRRWVQKDRAEVGEKVLVTKFAGFMAKGPADGEMYRLVNDRDVFCAITDEGDKHV